MIELIIHPKFGKTGTSSIQSFFSVNREQILEKSHLLYPRNGTGMIDPDSHHGVALCFGNQATISFDGLLANLEDEVSCSGCTKILISSEIIPYHILSDRRFCSFLNRINASVSLIFTIRDQISWLISMMGQFICDPGNDLFITPFTAATYLNDQLDFGAEIRRWSDSSAINNISILPYSKNIIPPFLESIGIETSLTYTKGENIQKNKSLQTSKLKIANEIKHKVLSTIFDQSIVSIEINHLLVPVPQVNAIVYICNECINRLTDIHFDAPIMFISGRESFYFMEKFNESNEAIYCEYGIRPEPIFQESDIYCFNSLTENGKIVLLESINSYCLELEIPHFKALQNIINSIT